MRTYDQPFSIEKIALNVKVDFLARGIIDREGSIVDIQAFKIALVSSIKKPITIRPGENLQAKLSQGHDILTRIRVFVVMRGERPVHAGFRKSKITLKKSETLTEYVIQRVQHEGDHAHDVQIVGEPALTTAQHQDLFAALACDLAKTQIFDEEPPAVAAALRNML